MNRFPTYNHDPSIKDSLGNVMIGSAFATLTPYVEMPNIVAAAQKWTPPPNHGSFIADIPEASGSFPVFLCPSDYNSSLWNPELLPEGKKLEDEGVEGYTGQSAFTSYRICRGDLARSHEYFGANDRPMLRTWCRMTRPGTDGLGAATFSAITSGTSQSIAFAEGLLHDESGGQGTNSRTTIADLGGAGDDWCTVDHAPNKCTDKVVGGRQWRAGQATTARTGDNLGRRAWHDWVNNVAFYALMPPNGPNCMTHDRDGFGRSNVWTSAGSYHPGGVNVGLLDGSVRLVIDTINVQYLNRVGTVDGNHPGAYPRDADGRFSYGVWAELGAVNSTVPVSF
jgi:prepilin-type processing-associated H-X9-DG protein